MDPPTPMGLFLGAEHDMFTMKHPAQKDKVSRGMSYNVMDKLQSCLNRYIEIAGLKGPLRPADTPFTADLCKGACDSVFEGPWIECPVCNTRSPENFVCYGVDSKIEKVASSLHSIVEAVAKESVDIVRGALADDVASLVMQLLFAARIGRFDLL